MKHDTVYNHSHNMIYVRSQDDLIYVICQNEEQEKQVVERMNTDKCILEDYEVWEDERVILTFRVLDEYDIKSTDLN